MPTSVVARCKCGRPYDLAHPHCPRCGSGFKYALQRADRIVYLHPHTAELVEEDFPGASGCAARGFKCRSCGHEYCEADPCEAPSPRPTARSQEIRTAIVKSLPSYEQQVSQVMGAVERYRAEKALEKARQEKEKPKALEEAKPEDLI